MNRGGPERTKAVPFAAILLAAGFSSRLGRFKPLLDLGGRPLIEHVVSIFHGCGISEIHCVVGHRREEVSPVLDRLGVHAVENPDFRRGMFTSVAAGTRHVSPDRTGFFVMPVDIPLVRPDTLRRLMAAHEEHPSAGGAVLHPCFRGERGHPPLLPAAMIEEIARWDGPGGLRGLFDSSDTPSFSVDVWDRNILFDLDTPEDHRELLERWRTYHLPAPEECEAILETLTKHG